MAQRDVFSRRLRFGGVRTEIFFTFSTIFAKKREILYFRNVELQSAITPVLWKLEPWSLRIAECFRKWRLELCHRHLCHVTESDHAHQFGVKQHFDRV